jgi:hypothetical protein
MLAIGCPSYSAKPDAARRIIGLLIQESERQGS